MGNDLEKQYNLKQKPIRLPGSYSFLKFVDHPTDVSSSLIVIKDPHKAGIVNSEILLPIKEIKNLGYSDYTVATSRKCKPLSLIKPRSESEMKLIIRQIIKLGAQLGRIFLCDGRLMLWCEEIRSQWLRSPQEIQHNKQSQKSKVFWSGLCLINYLNCVYQKDAKNVKKKNEKKTQIQAFFDPKDKKQYYDLFDNMQYKLSKSNFWSSISQGMKNLILVMLAKEQNDRIDLKTLIQLPYFATQKQLRLYHILSDELINWQEKQSIIAMETVEMVIHDRVIFDDLILKEYITPLLVSLLEKKPEVILSAIVQLPDPPTLNIVACIKKANPKNMRLFHAVLLKIQKLHTILISQQYDAVISRTAFCSFELPVLLQKLIRVIPFILRTVKQPNYKKQIEFQVITNVIENKGIDKNILLQGLKCIIQMLNEGTISNVNKLYNVKFEPQKYEAELEINLHILEMYRLMILSIESYDLIRIMMPKLDPYLSKQQVTNELFFNAKKCVDLIMSRLAQAKSLGSEDEININYEPSFFALETLLKPSQSDIVAVLKKEASKSKIQDIVWLTQILQKQQPLSDI